MKLPHFQLCPATLETLDYTHYLCEKERQEPAHTHNHTRTHTRTHTHTHAHEHTHTHRLLARNLLEKVSEPRIGFKRFYSRKKLFTYFSVCASRRKRESKREQQRDREKGRERKRLERDLHVCILQFGSPCILMGKGEGERGCVCRRSEIYAVFINHIISFSIMFNNCH